MDEWNEMSRHITMIKVAYAGIYIYQPSQFREVELMRKEFIVELL